MQIRHIRRINRNVKVLLGLIRKREDEVWIREQLINLVKAQQLMIAIMNYLHHNTFDGLHLDFAYGRGEHTNRASTQDFDRFALVSAGTDRRLRT